MSEHQTNHILTFHKKFIYLFIVAGFFFIGLVTHVVKTLSH